MPQIAGDSRLQRSRPPSGRVIGYARVSTEEQATDAQAIELKATGCDEIVTEHGSGASRARPALARLLDGIQAGDVLVVVRLDRLARSVSHLLDVIEELTLKGAHFRSLRDPIDTSTPQGMFSLQVLGAVAQLERALISERTKAGIKAAKAKGRLPGNPGLRQKATGSVGEDGSRTRTRIRSKDSDVARRLVADSEAASAGQCLGRRHTNTQPEAGYTTGRALDRRPTSPCGSVARPPEACRCCRAETLGPKDTR